MTTVTETDEASVRWSARRPWSTYPSRPCGGSLEAVLMVADQPLDAVTLATAVGYPVGRGGRRAAAARRGVRRAGPRLRAAQRGRRLALLHPRGVRRRRRGVRPRRSAGPADPGRARDARRGRLQAAGLAGPGLGDPRRQRRRRDAHPAHPRPGRGGRRGPDDRRAPLPHHQLLPGADRRRVDRRAARAGAVPPGPRRHGRSCEGPASPTSHPETPEPRAQHRPDGGTEPT